MQNDKKIARKNEQEINAILLANKQMPVCSALVDWHRRKAGYRRLWPDWIRPSWTATMSIIVYCMQCRTSTMHRHAIVHER